MTLVVYAIVALLIAAAYGSDAVSRHAPGKWVWAGAWALVAVGLFVWGLVRGEE